MALSHIRITGGDATSHSTAYEASRVAKSTGGKVFTVIVYNSGPQQWIQLHDASSLPANGVAPEVTVLVGATQNVSIDWSAGRPFVNGIVVCNSTTGPTKTIGAADCWIDVVYT